MTGSGEKPKRRLFRLLRRGVRETGESASTSGAAEESALWMSHQRASQAVRETAEGAQRIASQVAKQRSVVEALADRARGVAARSSDLTASFARLQDGFGRLELVALNAGLEGARFGEGPGQALGLVAEEVRAQSTRGSETCRELAIVLGELGGELGHVHSGLDRVRESSAEASQEAARVGSAAVDAERALGELNARLRSATGSDPETARAIADAMDHARALVSALAVATAKAPRALVLAALRPVLEPLFRLVEGEDAAER